jgi:hypothetical protein
LVRGVFMAKTPKREDLEIETDPEAWERFQKAVHTLAKAKPHHREAPKPKPKRRPAKRA